MHTWFALFKAAGQIHGEGQTLLREALQIADHTAYHVAEIVSLDDC